MKQSISVSEVVYAARQGAVNLNAELVGFMALSAAEQCRQLPRCVLADCLRIDADGLVSVDDARQCESAEAAEALRVLLRRLLAQAQSTGPALLSVASEPSPTLADWRGRLEAALIPLNRAASKRALARLYRDVTRCLGEAPADRASDEQAFVERGFAEHAFAEQVALQHVEPEPKRFGGVGPDIATHETEWLEPTRGGATPVLGSPLPGPIRTPDRYAVADDRLTPPLGSAVSVVKGSLTPIAHLPKVRARRTVSNSEPAAPAASPVAISHDNRVVDIGRAASRPITPHAVVMPRIDRVQDKCSTMSVENSLGRAGSRQMSAHRQAGALDAGDEPVGQSERAVRRSDVRELADGFDAQHQLGDKELARTLRGFAGLTREGLTLTPPPVGIKNSS